MEKVRYVNPKNIRGQAKITMKQGRSTSTKIVGAITKKNTVEIWHRLPMLSAKGCQCKVARAASAKSCFCFILCIKFQKLDTGCPCLVA